MKLPLIIALDFDMTIADSHPFPAIKGFRKGAEKYIRKLHKEGYYIIIWTCRTDKEETCNDAQMAREFLEQNDVPFHLFNENHPALINCFKNNCRKIACDLYVDDKGLWPFGIPSWRTLYWMIKWKSWFLKPKQYILSHCKPEHFEY